MPEIKVRSLDRVAMTEYVEEQMTAYRLQLKEMISEHNSTKQDTKITANLAIVQGEVKLY